MSVAKPFVFARVSEQLGPSEMQRLIGVNATGLAFDSWLQSSTARADARTQR